VQILCNIFPFFPFLCTFKYFRSLSFYQHFNLIQIIFPECFLFRSMTRLHRSTDDYRMNYYQWLFCLMLNIRGLLARWCWSDQSRLTNETVFVCFNRQRLIACGDACGWDEGNPMREGRRIEGGIQTKFQGFLRGRWRLSSMKVAFNSTQPQDSWSFYRTFIHKPLTFDPSTQQNPTN
jgi:hypothetical protein